jgi:Tol biopolymer transport system component
MDKRRGQIRHSLLLGIAAVAAGCMGGEEEHMQLAYGVVRNDEVPTRIIVVEDDGTDAERVTGARRGQPPILPKWSPDGTKIAFIRFNPLGGPGALQTYVVNADGSGERRLGEGTLPEWTPDGRFVVVEQSAAPPKPSEVHVLSVDGEGDRKLANGSAPAVSHDGKRVAFVRYTYRRRGKSLETSSALYTIALDGTGQRLLARSTGRNIRWVQPSWLPDDSAVAVAQRTGAVVGSGPLLTFSMSGRRREIVPEVGETYDWSPLGDLVAYTGRGVLFLVRPDGTEINSYGESNAIDVEFSPDGKRVAYSVQEVLQTEVTVVGLYVVDLDEEVRRRFALTDGFVAYLDWRPLPKEDS